ncbi:TPA: ABC transporter ATP-binding protein [Streptococcus agalactiae]|uniref:ABC transporter ATP-binding protein n=1 Tax=Streptococcus agalactiae TaxID=1311 RepID=UPI000640215E|nr:ABC transporter ATP-binding protein [Streptococcus agalactiae]KLJ51968.1 ABC transporter ATP-binding protein [Streptococcus agalactiae]
MDVLRRLYKYAPEKRGYSYVSMILSAIATILSVIPYLYLWKFLNELLVIKNIESANKYALWIFMFMVLQTVVYFLSLYCSHIFAFRVERNLKIEGLNNLLDASFSFFDTNPSGKTRQIIDDNASETHSILAHMQPDMVNAVVYPIILLIVSFLVSIKLGIVMVGSLIIGIFLIIKMFGNQNFLQNYMDSNENMSSEIVEYIRGIKVVKIFNIGIEKFQSLHKTIINSSELGYAYSLSCRKWKVFYDSFFMGLCMIMIPYGLYLLNMNTSTGKIISYMVFFAAFTELFYIAFNKVMFLGQNKAKAKNSIDKLEDIFNKMQVKKLESKFLNEIDSFDIEFENVSFKYEEGSNYVLKDLSFKLDSGKSYALIGSSGSGKSTIAKLISGFYEIDSGKIKIGSRDIKDYSREAIARSIAFVFQNAKLFKISIYENVRIGNPKATYNEVMKALEEARCNDILDKFELRENTVIGSKGVYLSGGETQRIVIARAILKNSPIIILDEASAAADPENEYELQIAFSKLIKNKTVIMIAHRLSAIKNIDEIIVVENGEIVERGSSKVLLENKSSKYNFFMDMYLRANDWVVSNEVKVNG